MNPDDELRLLEMLKRHEGFRAELYRCSKGKPSIGYGHNCEAHGDLEKYRNRTLTEAEATELLKRDKAEALGDCQKIPTFDLFSGVRQAALVDMVFNMGIGIPGGKNGVLGFKNTLRCLQLGDRKGAARGIIKSEYARDTGVRAAEIVFMILTDEFLEE